MERMKKVGSIAPKSAMDVKKTRLGIGFEKLDRNVFDPEKASVPSPLLRCPIWGCRCCREMATLFWC